MQRVVAIIPARYDSARFPGKPLALLKGKPIIQHVYEQVKQASLVDAVLVATDDKRIYNSVTDFGGSAVMTSENHHTGTDRVAEAAGKMECELVVNVQGDEPFIEPAMVDDVVSILDDDERASMGTLAKKITEVNEILSSDVVKVVLDDKGFAMYFSRAPIPFYRDDFPGMNDAGYNLKDKKITAYKHIGIYGYRRDTLLRISLMKQNDLEKAEKLEQLRALSSGINIKVRETEYDTCGIDTAEDLRKAEEWPSLSS